MGKNTKKYASKFMQDNLRNSMTKNRFSQQFQKIELNSESDLEFFGLVKRKSVQKYTIMTISCHEIIFHTSVSTSSFCFHCYFGGPFDLTLIVNIVV